MLHLLLELAKKVNDTYGHHIGDLVLQEVAQRIMKEIRKEDTLARLSGDEFTIIMGSLSSAQDASILAQKILLNFQSPIIIHKNQEVFISISIGISIYPLDAKSEFELIKAADMAMYKAKFSGKNQFKYYED